MTDALRNAFGGGRGRGDRYEYNPLGESLMDNQTEEGQQESEDLQRTGNQRPSDLSSGEGGSRPGSATSKMNEWGRSLKQRWQNFIAGSGNSNTRSPEEDGWSSALQQDSIQAPPPPVSRGIQGVDAQGQRRPQRNAQQADYDQPVELDINSTISTARVTGELLQDTTSEAARNPVEAVELADTMNDVSRVCEAAQRELALYLSNETLWGDEALLNSALEVNDLLTRALAAYARLMGVTPGQAQPVEEAPVPQQPDDPEPLAQQEQLPVSSAPEPTVAQESEEDMIARAIAESLKSEEDRKARFEDVEDPSQGDLLGDLSAPPAETPAMQGTHSADPGAQAVVAAVPVIPAVPTLPPPPVNQLVDFADLTPTEPVPSPPVSTSPQADPIVVPTSQPVISPPQGIQDEFNLLATRADTAPPQPLTTEAAPTAASTTSAPASLIDL